jgi:uncharacterized protein GlcG (DUF336 family)
MDDGLYGVTTLSLDRAIELSRNAIDIARQAGHKICVTIVDVSGCVQLCMRDDGANYVTPESSRKKAFTSAATGGPTLKMAERFSEKPHLFQLTEAHDSLMLYGGGCPIVLHDEKVGGIGVADASGGHLDHEIVVEALRSVGAEVQG